MAGFGTCVGYVLVLASLGLAPPAAAQADAPAEVGMVGGVPMMNPENLAKAEAGIGIRPDQKDEWRAYADAVAGALENSDSMHQSMTPKSISQMSPADRQALMTAMHEQRRDSLQQVTAARAKLFAVLNDTQRAKARDLLGEAPHGMMMSAPAK